MEPWWRVTAPQLLFLLCSHNRTCERQPKSIPAPPIPAGYAIHPQVPQASPQSTGSSRRSHRRHGHESGSGLREDQAATPAGKMRRVRSPQQLSGTSFQGSGRAMPRRSGASRPAMTVILRHSPASRPCHGAGRPRVRAAVPAAGPRARADAAGAGAPARARLAGVDCGLGRCVCQARTSAQTSPASVCNGANPPGGTAPRACARP